MQSDKDGQISLSSNATWIEMGSIKPDESRLHSKKLAELGVNYLDAPVSGGTKGAENGTLAIMVGGQRSVFKKVNFFKPESSRKESKETYLHCEILKSL